jgi:hypothetical protein
MPKRLSAAFPAKLASTGIMELVCPACFRTVTSSRDELISNEVEVAHVCDTGHLSELRIVLDDYALSSGVGQLGSKTA